MDASTTPSVEAQSLRGNSWRLYKAKLRPMVTQDFTVAKLIMVNNY